MQKLPDITWLLIMTSRTQKANRGPEMLIMVNSAIPPHPPTLLPFSYFTSQIPKKSAEHLSTKQVGAKQILLFSLIYSLHMNKKYRKL